MESIYQRLGAIHNCTSEEIRAEIEKAIKAGADNSDHDTKEKWKNMHGFGEKFLPLQLVFETNKKRHDYNQ